MAKYHFKLEQVLKYRQEIERENKLQLAVLRQELDDAEESLKQEEETFDRTGQEFLSRQQEGMTAAELLLYGSWMERKTSDLKEQRRQVDHLEGRVTEQREVLLEAARDKKALELLKQKGHTAFLKEEQGKENAFLEEIALRRNVGNPK